MSYKDNEKAQLYAMFAIVVLATALGNLSQTAVNSMLGGVDVDLGIDASLGQWFTTAYMLVVGITVPAVTFISRKLTTRNLILVAMALFLAGCAVDFLAANFAMMLVGRILQALSAGITVPLVQAIANIRFPDGQRATAMGIAGIALGFAPNIGPVLGGAMVDSLGWRSFFIMLAVISIALVAATFALVPKETRGSNADTGAQLDSVSLALSTLGFGGLLLAFSNASSVSLTSPFLWAPMAVGAVFVALFFLRQRSTADPLINLGIFKVRNFRSAMYVQCALMASFLGITLLASLYWQDLVGGTALEAGLIFVPATIAALFVNPLAGIFSDKIGVRPVALIGGTSLVIGSIGSVFMDATTPLWLVAVLQLFRGMGMSSLIGPTMTFALSDLPREITLDGSSFIVLIRQACASLGTAAMVLLVSTLSAAAATGAVAAALPYQAAFGFSAVFGVIMWLLIVVRIK